MDEWQRHMRRGDFEAAWQVSDALLRERAGQPCWDWPRHLQYIWDGTPLPGRRVLVRCYHGLGDTLMFIRYAPWLDCVVWAQPALLPLLRGMGDLLPLHDGVPAVEYDVDIEIMELPHAFRTTLDSIPGPVPYLHISPASLPATSRYRVGLVWSAGAWDRTRSLRFADLAPLWAVPGIEWHILQRGPALQECPSTFGMRTGSDDVVTAAQVMRALDLVITVDSMPAHLAGALGVPVWALLTATPDWRWMTERADSPWYPSMRLFRQRAPGHWANVLREVARALDSARFAFR